MNYKEARDEIISYVERQRDSFGSQLKAMEVDNYEQVSYWGGAECEECYQEPMEMYSFFKGQKGKGNGKGVLQWKHWEGPLRWHPSPT